MRSIPHMDLVGSAYTGADRWQRVHQIKQFTLRGVSESFAEAITNLLELHSMEAYQSGNGNGGTVWRVQYQKHSFRLSYCTVPGDWTSVAMWLQTCQEVEARYGHKR